MFANVLNVRVLIGSKSMLRKIKVEASYSGVLPTSAFGNLRPGFSASIEFEQDFKTEDEVKRAIEGEQETLSAICYKSFESEAVKAKVIKVQEDLKSFRFHDIDGEKFPSVSTVASYDKVFYCKEEDLPLYCAQGNIIDAEIRNFVRTGVWTDSKDLLECTADRFVLKNRVTESGKHLSMEPCKFREFLAKFPIENLVSIEKVISSKKHRIAGTPDLVGTYNGLKTLVSIKRTKSETDNMIQEAGYSLCEGMEDAQQFLVVEMKLEEDGGNKQGFSKPTVTTEIARYQELFLRKREEVKKIYGV